jgi:hypothetical protein
MTDRHQELLRQRALVEAHLAWLDREIAEAKPATPTSPPPASGLRLKTSPTPTHATLRHTADAILGHANATSPLPTAPREVTQADAILDEYRVPPDALKTDIRKGCFVYFALALTVVAVGVAGLYFLLNKGR